MSKKPYVVQEDSPNLVIVPTDCYEPAPKKPKLSDVVKIPTPEIITNNVFVKKPVSKLNFGAPVTNNNVIDVRKVKKSPTSWAANFLQSIGGSLGKFNNLFLSPPKTSSLRNENTQTESNKEIILPNPTKSTQQLKTNTNNYTMDKNTGLPKKPPININLIRPRNIPKPAHQPMTPKEISPPNGISKTNESKNDIPTNQTQGSKFPSLPKNYKIPTHSKCNKLTVQPVTHKEVIETSNVTSSSQANSDITKPHSVIPLPKTNHATIQPKHNKLVLPGKIMNKEIIYTLPKADTNKIHTNQEKVQYKNQKTTKELNYEKEVDLFLSKVTKVKEFKQSKNEPKSDKNMTRQPKISKAQQKKNKETNERKLGKDIKKPKVIKESELPKSYRDPLPEKYNKEVSIFKTDVDETCKESELPKCYRDPIPEKYNKEVSSRKTSEEVARSKINNKKDTYSTKLKTKKVTICSKSKHREATNHHQSTPPMRLPMKHDGQSKTNKLSNIEGKTSKTIKMIRKKPPQSSAIKVDLSPKKRKRVTENNTKKAEFTDYENNQHKEIETNISKKITPKAFNDERSSSSISPIKSVVKKIKTDPYCNSPENRSHKKLDNHTHVEKTSFKEFDHHKHNPETALLKEPNIDLRTKLKRQFNKKYYYKNDTEPFVPKENIIISFDAKDSNEEKVMAKTSPVKKLVRKQPPRKKKCKKIKLEINIVFDHADTTDEESIKTEDEASDEKQENTDLSFLDDFNVDEIVQSLNECKSNSTFGNDEPNLPVDDVEIQDILSNHSKTEDAEAMPTCRNSEVMTQIDSDTKTLLGYDNDQQTTEENRSLNQNTIESKHTATVTKSDTTSDIHKLPLLDNSMIKKEVGMNQNIETERTNALFECNKSQNGKCSASSFFLLEFTEIKSEIVTLSEHENVMPMEIAQDNVADEIHIMHSDVPMRAEKGTTSTKNNTEEDTKKYANGHPDFENAKNIVETYSINQIEDIKTEIFDMGAKCDVIIIDDSEGENDREIKDIQFVPKNEEMKKAAAISDEVLPEPTMAVKSESVLIFDTNNELEEDSNDNTKCQLSGTEQNENCKNLNSDCQVNTKETNLGDLVSQNETAENNSFEHKSKSVTESKSIGEETLVDSGIEQSEERKSQCKNTSSEDKKETNEATKSGVEIQHEKNENEDSSKIAKVAETNNSKITKENPNIKSTETVTKCTPKKVTVNAVKNDPEANSENEDKDETKRNTNARSDPIYNDKFIRKLGCKLRDITNQTYTITQLIHVGRFSKIYKCKDPRKRDFSVKVTYSPDGIRSGIEKHNMLMKLQNGVPEQNLNCVRFLEGFVVFGQWCFLMEYYPRNLKEALIVNKKSFHIDLVQVLSRQLVSAVTILRNNNIIHSDIKPSHILINASKTRLKLCGFDQAFYFDGSKLLPNTGTCNYRAPELILGYPAGYGIDVWSTALVMYEMATNKKLFPGIFNNDILYKQLCTLGSIPLEMLISSTYRHVHFIGTSFAKIMNAAGQRIIMDEITGNDKVNNILFQTYTKEWAKQRHPASVREDKAKLCAFSKLIYSMLAMSPRCRIAIEFVFADPFIYETFDD